ncbi:hypothetical protein SEA_HANS_56 [Gordonia phage Hans]|nr:hypothetical protein SEA_HANS_56 [Gordonia phage Hans]
MDRDTHRTHAAEHLDRLNDDALTEAGVHRTGYQAITHALLALTAHDTATVEQLVPHEVVGAITTDECADVEQCDECETVGQNCRAHATRGGWRTPTAHRYDIVDARDPKRAARLDADTTVTRVQPRDGDSNPAWRLGLLAGLVRREMNIEPLPVEITVDELVDDLEANVRELVESRNNWRDEHQAQQPRFEQLKQATRELAAAADLMLNIGVRPAPGEFTALAETTQRVQAAIDAARATLEDRQ